MTQLLNCEHFGTQEGVPFVIAHGLFGSGRNWRALARAFAKHRWVITVDMRNHAGSFWADKNDYPSMADDLARVIAAHGGKADLMGHSMGGKAAMWLALSQPDLIDRLIIADIAPVTYTHTQSHTIAMMQALPIDTFDRRSEAAKAIENTSGDPSLGAFLAQSLMLDDENARWLLNLEVLGADMNAIIGFPESENTYPAPCMFIRGSASEYATGAHEKAIQQAFPNASLVTLEGAGHWLHAEQPRQFISAVDAYLSEVQQSD